MNVLIVEDSPSVGRVLFNATREAGYEPQMEIEGNAALERAQNEAFDLILLDVMLPGLDGLSVCSRMRDSGNQSLVLMITARDTLEDKIAGLDAGADDYLVKPFQVAELLARMRALLRRTHAANGHSILSVGDLFLDPISRKARRDGKVISLSATEFTLLDFLMRNAGKTLPRAMILEHVWQYDFDGNDNVLDCYISYLRQKLDKGFPTRLIHTVRGVGFRLGTN